MKKSDRAFHPQQPEFNDGRSNLSDFLWQEAETTQAAGENAIASSRAHTAALKNGTLHGEEYYTQTARHGQDDESDAAVESRQISKEEFPQG